MRPIPAIHKNAISNDYYFQRCLLTGSYRPEIHHVFKYGGKQINELWAYAPLSKEFHRISELSAHKNQITKEYIEWVCLKRLSLFFAEPSKTYSKKDWQQLMKYLNGRTDVFRKHCQDNGFIFLDELFRYD